MKPETIRRLDVWLGKPACLVLTVLRRLGSLLRIRRAVPARATRILFIKLVEQGATVLAYPAIRRAVAMVGRENVFFWVFDTNREILDLMDVIPAENVLTIRQANLGTFLLDTLRGLRRIRRMGVDAVVDMEFFARASAILAFLTGAARRVGLHRFTSEGPYRGDLMTHRVSYNPHLHCAQFYDALVQALRRESGEVPLVKVSPIGLDGAVAQFVPTEEDRARVCELLEACGLCPPLRRLVLLNPNAGDLVPIRRWPAERFVELGNRLLASHQDVTVVITGARSERAAAENVCRGIDSRSAICVAGRTSLRDLVALCALSDVLVTNDSGPGHFAALTNIDIVVLFGPETPDVFGPLGPRTHVIRKDLACSPCVSAINHRFSPCTNNVCMQSISVDDVYEVVERCLAARGNATQ